MKKYLALWMIVTMLFSTTVYSFAFSDVVDGAQGADEINTLAEKNILAGYTDGTFRPEGTINRAEFVTMINKVKGYEPGVVGVYFSDVKETDWFYTFVKAGLQAGYFTGYGDNTFRPFNFITREEVCTMIAQVEELNFAISEEEINAIKIEDEISGYAEIFVKECIAAGLMDLDENGCFRAKELATRKEVAIACYRIMTKAETSADDQEEISGGGIGSVGETEEKEDVDNKEIIISVKQEKQITSLIRCIEESLLIRNDLNDDGKTILSIASNGMKQFLDDRTYDIYGNAKKARKIYNSMSEIEQERFQRIVSEEAYLYGITTSDLLDLKDYFF